MNAGKPTFSLVLCTVGRRDEIAAFFESLLRQNRDDYELILVDQNADDRLDAIVAAYADRFPLKHVKSQTRGLSRARNAGLRHATGALIGFPDDDCEYFDEYLNTVAALFKDESLGGITGYPVGGPTRTLADDWATGAMTLTRTTVLNRCQEFTIFVRREAMRGIAFNEQLGVGAGTPWGADEGPDFLIRVVEGGAKVVFYPRLFVYHPDKTREITPQIIHRAASYARGRGAYFRLHKHPMPTVARGVIRSAGGAVLYALKGDFARSKYYRAVVGGMLRGLTMGPAELAQLRQSPPATDPIAPMPLTPLPDRPLVSVLVANYNYARFLPAMLDSLLAQTYDHWEAVVCDDGSTDGSPGIVRRHAERDGRIRLVEKPNGGQNSTVNACYTHLTGDVICLLDSDDTFAPDKLRRVVDALRANPQAGVVNHFAAIIDAAGRELPVTLNTRLDRGWLGGDALGRGGCVYVPTTSCMSFRREVLDRLMPLPPAQKRDADGYLGMAAQFLTPFVVIDAKLAGYRVHGNNMGGLTEPTPQRLQYELTLISERTANLKAFVAETFGSASATRLRVEDNPQYLQAALKMHAVGDAAMRRPLASVGDLVVRHPSPKWRVLWRTLLSLPGPLRRRAVPMLHRSHALKAAVRRWFSRPAVQA